MRLPPNLDYEYLLGAIFCFGGIAAFPIFVCTRGFTWSLLGVTICFAWFGWMHMRIARQKAKKKDEEL